MIVAALGDSITEGSPEFDSRRGGNAASQWEHWAARTDPGLAFRNHGVHGQRTDEILARLDEAAAGADVLVVQGGINDIVQGHLWAEAAMNIAAMVVRGRAAGLAVAVADVLPWNNGDERAAEDIACINDVLGHHSATLLPFHDTLADPADPTRMGEGLTDDGDHPSIEGHRLLGERAFRLPPLDV